MKIRCRRLSFGPEPKYQEPHFSDASKIHVFGGFLIWKALQEWWSYKRGNISLRKTQGMLFESACFDNSESDDSHSFKYPKSVLKTA